MFSKNRFFFSQKIKFWSKSEIFDKKRNFGQKVKFWSKNEMLVKKLNFGQTTEFWSKVKFW